MLAWAREKDRDGIQSHLDATGNATLRDDSGNLFVVPQVLVYEWKNLWFGRPWPTHVEAMTRVLYGREWAIMRDGGWTADFTFAAMRWEAARNLLPHQLAL
jgi:hypothetical protein